MKKVKKISTKGEYFDFVGNLPFVSTLTKGDKMLKSKDTVFEIIKKIPADSMVSLSFTQLREFENRLKKEIIFYSLKHKEKTKVYQRAVLALRWVQGIIRIKTINTMKGPKNG